MDLAENFFEVRMYKYLLESDCFFLKTRSSSSSEQDLIVASLTLLAFDELI